MTKIYGDKPRREWENMSEETNNNVEQELDLNQLMIIRREKLEKLKQENKKSIWNNKIW